MTSVATNKTPADFEAGSVKNGGCEGAREKTLGALDDVSVGHSECGRCSSARISPSNDRVAEHGTSQSAEALPCWQKKEGGKQAEVRGVRDQTGLLLVHATRARLELHPLNQDA